MTTNSRQKVSVGIVLFFVILSVGIGFVAGFAVGHDAALTGPGEPDGFHEPVYMTENNETGSQLEYNLSGYEETEWVKCYWNVSEFDNRTLEEGGEGK